MKRPKTTSSTHSLAAGAAAAIALFPLIVLALNLVQRAHYSLTRQAISELALGSGGALMAVAFCGLGLGIGLVAVIVRRTAPSSRVMPGLLAIAAVLAGPFSAGFHTDATGAKSTLHGTIHNDAGLAAFLLILAAMGTGAFRLRSYAYWRPHAGTTTGFTVLAVATFLLIPALGDNDFGLAQRLFVGTFVSWLLVTALYAARRSTTDGVITPSRRRPAAAGGWRRRAGSTR